MYIQSMTNSDIEVENFFDLKIVYNLKIYFVKLKYLVFHHKL